MTRSFFFIAGLIMAVTSADAQRSSGLSSNLPDGHTLSIQRKVEILFDQQNYERAFFIYRHELVPVGDKYAQYMVGFMHSYGLGVEEDVVMASAWFRLAAGRDTPEFVNESERLIRVFTEQQLRRSDFLLSELRLQYSDMAVLLKSIKRNVRVLDSRTGSRLRGESNQLVDIGNRGSGARPGGDFYENQRKQLKDRLTLLVEMGGFEDIDAESTRVNLVALERLVEDHIRSRNKNAE